MIVVDIAQKIIYRYENYAKENYRSTKKIRQVKIKLGKTLGNQPTNPINSTRSHVFCTIAWARVPFWMMVKVYGLAL